jgi:hypothetical protein
MFKETPSSKHKGSKHLFREEALFVSNNLEGTKPDQHGCFFILAFIAAQKPRR